MPRPSKRVRLATPIETHVEDSAGWIRTGRHRAVPLKFYGRALLTEPQCEVELVIQVRQDDGVPTIDELRVSRTRLPLGPSITPSLLHDAAINELLRLVVAEVGEPIVNREDAGPGVFQLVRDVENGSDVAWGGPATRNGRGRDATEERLEHVAVIYRAAVTAGEPPVVAVAKQLPCARSTAGRLVSQARERGFLPKTKPGRVTT